MGSIDISKIDGKQVEVTADHIKYQADKSLYNILKIQQPDNEPSHLIKQTRPATQFNNMQE